MLLVRHRQDLEDPATAAQGRTRGVDVTGRRLASRGSGVPIGLTTATDAEAAGRNGATGLQLLLEAARASAPPLGVAGGSGSAVATGGSVEGAAQVALRRLLRGC